MPRPAVAPAAGMTVHSALPAWRIRTSPSNPFGSGMASVASVPVISTKPCRRSGESKLSSTEAAAPSAYPSSEATYVGTATPNRVPARGPRPMTRWSRLRRPTAATETTGPNTLASAVR